MKSFRTTWSTAALGTSQTPTSHDIRTEELTPGIGRGLQNMPQYPSDESVLMLDSWSKI